MTRILKILGAVAVFLYPVLVYSGLTRFGIGLVAPALLVIFALRVFLPANSRAKEFFSAGAVLACIGGGLCALSWIFRDGVWLLWYPAASNAFFLCVFGMSLLRPPSVAERLARLTDPNLPPEAVPYTRNVTRAWCVFFLVNGAIAVGTCLYGDMRLWTLYNGAIAYVLIGLFFVIEFWIRSKVKRKIDREKNPA